MAGSTREEAERLLAGLAREIDDRKEIEWIQDRATVALVVGGWLKLYFGRREDRVLPLRLKLQREWDGAPKGCDLLFDVDGRTHRLPTERSDWMSDEGGGTTWVMADVPISTRDPELLQHLAQAAEVRIRIDAGPAPWSWVVPRPQAEAAARVYAAWRALSERESAGA